MAFVWSAKTFKNLNEAKERSVSLGHFNTEKFKKNRVIDLKCPSFWRQTIHEKKQTENVFLTY